MPGQQVNGEVPHSAFLEHLLGYPVINDGVSTFKSNPYGQKSIELSDSAYKVFAEPVLPYFSMPYQYVSPYLKKADDLGDKTLSKVDKRFPVVKKPTGELYENARSLVLYPYRTGMAGKDHVLSTYNSEIKKVGGESHLIVYSKALLSTTLIVTTEVILTISTYLGSKKKEAKSAMDEKVNN